RVRTRRIELRELAKDLAMLFGRNPSASVPDLDPEPSVLTATSEDQPATIGVPNGVRYEVAQYPLEQSGIGADISRGFHDAQRQALLLRHRPVFEVQSVEYRGERKSLEAGPDDARVQPRDIQQGIEQLLHRIDGAPDIAHD